MEKPGEVVTREELRRCLWPSDVFVDFDHGLNKSIQKLREVLGDSAVSPRYIETIPRVGYRFIAPVSGATALLEPESDVEIAPQQDLPAMAAPARTPGIQKAIWILIACCIAVVALAGVLLIHRRFQALEAIQSLAVLPLDNLSGDPGQEYLADGMTDEMITRLAKDSNLNIISRTSVMQYKGSRRPLPEIARALHVDAIIEGSVSRSGNRVHMTLQLIRAQTDSHLWADSYDRDTNDETLADEAARAIAKKLGRTVPEITLARYVNPAAHDAYLRGQYLWFTARMEESGAWFQKAIDIQPDFAAAWAGLSDYYGEGVADDVLDPRTSLGPEEQAARRALELDPNSAQAHAAMGASFFFARWDLGSADREMLRAISIDPRNGELYSLRSYLLLVLNRPAEAIDSAKKAMELGPFSRPYALALIYTLARRYDEALADFRLRFEASPDNPNLLGMEMDTWLRKGNYKEAVNVWAKWHIVTGDPESAANLRRAWEQGGAHGFVRWQLGRRLMQSKSRYVSPVELASYYAQLGDPERTLAMLEEGYRQRSPDILFIQGNPAYDFLHGDPRYRSLLQKAGVPPTY